ncbi:hypothetical protein BT63DRAFT_440784 [Microthyrium microscopicum]|uniref:MARVEL domain-containing protein n=1 Tax=Microthyrium microscopicum TaxID=703497 RepID=A0A6A6UAN7_9PEZI|nr:hypothetical protein BT63DRAFT_440784 [Microthyrium microscopicum]
MAFGSAALKFLGTFLYALACCCSIVILALYSYFLSTLHTHGAHIPTWERAIEGISGAGVLYTLLAIVFTCCLGGKTFFAFLAIVLDILFCGAFIAIAVMARQGTGSCSSSNVKTPIGNGDSQSHVGFDGKTFTPSLHTACIMNKAVFAVAIIGAGVFLISAFVQLWIGRHHQKQKKYGPSPANGYTKGNGISFFKKRGANKSAHAAAAKDAEAGLNGHEHVAAHDSTDPRYGDATYTGNKFEAAPVTGTNGRTYDDAHHTAHHTAHQNATNGTNGVGYSAPAPTAGGYHTGPAGSAVNPYGYDNNARTNY